MPCYLMPRCQCVCGMLVITGIAATLTLLEQDLVTLVRHKKSFFDGLLPSVLDECKNDTMLGFNTPTKWSDQQ